MSNETYTDISSFIPNADPHQRYILISRSPGKATDLDLGKFATGELRMGDAPLAPAMRLMNGCFVCLKETSRDGGKLRVCAKCNRARYCSRGCQKAHWKAGHKAVCDRWKNGELSGHVFVKLNEALNKVASKKQSGKHAEVYSWGKRALKLLEEMEITDDNMGVSKLVDDRLFYNTAKSRMYLAIAPAAAQIGKSPLKYLKRAIKFYPIDGNEEKFSMLCTQYAFYLADFRAKSYDESKINAIDDLLNLVIEDKFLSTDEYFSQAMYFLLRAHVVATRADATPLPASTHHGYVNPDETQFKKSVEFRKTALVYLKKLIELCEGPRSEGRIRSAFYATALHNACTQCGKIGDLDGWETYGKRFIALPKDTGDGETGLLTSMCYWDAEFSSETSMKDETP